jgi:tRNA(Ile)-lysidine synthase
LNQEVLNDHHKYLLAVSGGIDSVVMLDLFKDSGKSIGIAHCNFQLRGEDSENDEEFVRKLASDLDVPLFVERFNTSEYGEENGLSIQMAARELRYAWFNRLLEETDFEKVALAHHKDDQLETILFNLAKGTGIAGLTGMQIAHGNYVRPLLFASKTMIEDYAEKNHLSWREDVSNDSLKYSRNLIRHKVIPQLKEINPGVLETLDYTLLRLVETESALDEKILDFLNRSVEKRGEDIYLDKSDLKDSVVPTLALHRVTSGFGFNYQQCVNIIHAIDHVGKVFYGNQSVLNIDRESLILSPVSEENFHSAVYKVMQSDEQVELGDHTLMINKLSPDKTKILSSADFAFLDLDKLQFPLRIRHWASGDWFIPLGMSGKKKISDLMIDEKIPLNLKSRVLILESGEDIVWVIGHRIDDRYKVTDSTRQIWRAEYGKV